MQVDLVEDMGSMVGTGNGVGLSTEQRKRLTIAVELVANPAAIFMVQPPPSNRASTQSVAAARRGSRRCCGACVQSRWPL